MIKKKKICSFCKQEKYIWSKGKCKECTTYKKHTNKKFDTKELHNFMYEWWKTFGNYKHCMACNSLLPIDFSTANVDHLLPKNKYPELAFNTDNFFLVCFECHNLKEMGYPKEKHKYAIDKIKNDCNQ